MAEADRGEAREIDTEPLLRDTSPNQSCPICREDLNTSDAKFECHGCRKLFHYSCYHRHLQFSVNCGCPCCRYGEASQSENQNQGEPNQQHINPNHILPMFFVNSNAGQNPQHDPRITRYLSLSCTSYCYFFLLLVTFPLSSFIYWPYSLIIWLACWSGSAFGIYKLGFLDTRMLLYGSIGFGFLSMIFASILAVHSEVIWTILFAICAGGEWGTISIAFHHLYLLRRELRQEGLLS